jgi:hypothetical protein
MEINHVNASHVFYVLAALFAVFCLIYIVSGWHRRIKVRREIEAIRAEHEAKRNVRCGNNGPGHDEFNRRMEGMRGPDGTRGCPKGPKGPAGVTGCNKSGAECRAHCSCYHGRSKKPKGSISDPSLLYEDEIKLSDIHNNQQRNKNLPKYDGPEGTIRLTDTYLDMKIGAHNPWVKQTKRDNLHNYTRTDNKRTAEQRPADNNNDMMLAATAIALAYSSEPVSSECVTRSSAPAESYQPATSTYSDSGSSGGGSSGGD